MLFWCYTLCSYIAALRFCTATEGIMTNKTARASILASLETRDSYDQAVREGAALRGELGAEAYVIAHGLDLAPVALDVGDLYTALRVDRLLAVAMLSRLSRPQFVAVAWAYASYLQQLGRDVTADEVLANFERGLAAYSIEVR